MRVAFLGTPDFALPTLHRLLEAGHEITLVVSQPARPSGRSRRVTEPPVAQFATEHRLALQQPEKLSEATIGPLRAAEPEVLVVAAFGQILPRSVLELPPGGCLNVHPSLLPRWRGASPVQAALLAGDQVTGVSIIRLTREMDAGPIVAQQTTRIGDREDSLALEHRLAEIGAHLLVEVLEPWVSGRLSSTSQDDAEVTYCRRLTRTDAALDWSNPAVVLDRTVRAFRGRGDAYTRWNGRLLKILRATPSAIRAPGLPGLVLPSQAAHGDERPLVVTGDGCLRLDDVAIEGRAPTPADAFIRGFPALIGSQLGNSAARD